MELYSNCSVRGMTEQGGFKDLEGQVVEVVEKRLRQAAVRPGHARTPIVAEHVRHSSLRDYSGHFCHVLTLSTQCRPRGVNLLFASISDAASSSRRSQQYKQ